MANSSVLIQAFNLPVAASTKISAEDHIMYDANGNAAMLADTSGCVYAGQAEQDADNTNGTAAAIACKVRPPGAFEARFHRWACTSALATWVGKQAFALTLTTAGLTASSTNKVTLGRIVFVESATSIIVDMADRSALSTT